MCRPLAAKPKDYGQIAQGASTAIRAKLVTLSMEEGIVGGGKSLLEGAALLVAFETRKIGRGEEPEVHEDAVRVLRTLEESPPLGTYLSLIRDGICQPESVKDFVALCFELSSLAKTHVALKAESLKLRVPSLPASFREHVVDALLSDAYASPQERFEAAVLSAYLYALSPGEAGQYSDILKMSGVCDFSGLFAKVIDIPSETVRDPRGLIGKIRSFLNLQLAILGFDSHEEPDNPGPDDPVPPAEEEEEPAPITKPSIVPCAKVDLFRPVPEGSVSVFPAPEEPPAISSEGSNIASFIQSGTTPAFPAIFTDDQIINDALLALEGLESKSLEDLDVLEPGLYQLIIARNLQARFASALNNDMGEPGSMDQTKRLDCGTKPSNPPIPASSNAESLRQMDLRGRSMDDGTMCRLICLECFKLGTAKPIIGGQYAPISVLRSNLQWRLKGDLELNRQFARVWKAMDRAGAIAHKRDAASLQPNADFTDPIVKDAVAWATRHHRQIRNPPQTDPSANHSSGGHDERK